MSNRTPQAVSIDRLGRSRIVSPTGRRRSLCGRCGCLVSEREHGQVRYCRDCIKVDPVFCGWA